MAKVDLNSDLGESFGAYTLGMDEQVLEVISSCNIACGFHAGDPGVMEKTVRLAMKNSTAIGAHPGLPD
ncbi:MAG: LamB/YcsF family protein, partial [Treponema sp.]|nr:LamB/YcsF family protein [Treponema sp.]